MNNKKVQVIAMNAMIAAVYAVLTILISPIAYGAVQMRLTEIIVLLACYNKKFIPGLTIGCLLANLASPMGLYDICFGTAATLIACLGMYYFKNVFVGAFIGGAVNGLIVGLELYLALELPFMINAFYVFARCIPSLRPDAGGTSKPCGGDCNADKCCTNERKLL